MPNRLRIADLRPHGEADVYTRCRTPGHVRSFRVRTPFNTFAFVGLIALLIMQLGLFARACTSTADAHSDQLAELALSIAVVAAHEGALDNVRDTALIWQVVEARAQTPRGRLAFLRLHSPRALGIAPCTAGSNCEWSTELLGAPSKTPASVDAGYWRTVRAPQWTLVQRKALGLVYGVDDDRPCDCAVYSWGFAGDVTGALARGLRPCGCAGVLNDGFALAPRSRSSRDVLSADVAQGKSSTP